MKQRYLFYGYKIINGKAEIDESQAAQVRGIYQDYLKGLSYQKAAANNGLKMDHSSVKMLLQNRYYLGDDFYPQLIDKQTFDETEVERKRRAEHLGRTHMKKLEIGNKRIPTAFKIDAVDRKYKDPFRQAEYVYSQIEREE